MSETEFKIVFIFVFLMSGLSLMANMVFFFANLKLYTEIMKEKSQRERRAAQPAKGEREP